MSCSILIVDDESLTRKSLEELLRGEGHAVLTADNGQSALQVLERNAVDIVLSDMKMPQLGGMELLRAVKQRFPQLAVILMTGYGRIENAVEAMRLGAFDFLTKPIDDNQLKDLIARVPAAAKRQIVSTLAGQLPEGEASEEKIYRFHHVVGANDKMRRIYALIESIADSPSTVLIYGESGTGKRVIAQAIHQADTSRHKNAFVEVSCGALPETLLESELFGHVKGAFTGAIKDRTGRFELADGGTIFLDEIDTCSPSLQVKLLRVLQEGEFERVGDMRTRKTSARVVAATNQSLDELVRRKVFREDLFWRLNVISLSLPPLRHRPDDIEMLIHYFLLKYNPIRLQMKKSAIIEQISPEAMQAMLSYNWPGNVRELENTIERACILVKNNVLRVKDLPETISAGVTKSLSDDTATGSGLRSALRVPERDMILTVLARTQWNCSRAAAELGINRTTLYNKMKLYRIARPQTSPILPE